MVEPVRTGSALSQEGCTHHWRIASPAGETSTGICLLCGASREFQNYVHRSPAPGRPRRPASQEMLQ